MSEKVKMPESESWFARLLVGIGLARRYVGVPDYDDGTIKWRAIATELHFFCRLPVLVFMDVYPVCPHDGSYLEFAALSAQWREK